MRSWFRSWLGHSMRIGVAPDGAALVRTSFWPHEPDLFLGEARTASGDPAALGAAVAALAAEHGLAGWPVSIVLSDELVRLWQVTPPPGSTRLSDLEGAAALRFANLFGALPADWKMVADWDAARPFLAAALPQPLLRALAGAAEAGRFHLVEVVPQFVAALNQHRRERRPGAWFGLVHGAVLSIAAYDGARLAAVRTSLIPDGADREWLEGHVAREALRVGLGRPERLQISGPAPTGWASSAGRLKFACTLLGSPVEPLWSDNARLALTGRRG